jgi:hypothetical protein
LRARDSEEEEEDEDEGDAPTLHPPTKGRGKTNQVIPARKVVIATVLGE